MSITRAAPAAEQSSREFRWSAPILLVALILGALLLAVFSLDRVASRGDQVSIDRQIREIRGAIASGIDEIARGQKMVTVSDDAAVELRRPAPSLDWIDANMARPLRDSFGHDQFYVLDAQDNLIYGVHEGARSDVSLHGPIRAALQPLVNAVRGKAKGAAAIPDAISPPHGSAVRVHDDPAFAAGLISLLNRPAIVSVMRHQPAGGSIPAPDAGREPLLVGVRFLDSQFLAWLEHRHRVEAPRFSRQGDAHAGEQVLPLTGYGGQPIGFMIWRPELPGTAMMRALAPIGVPSMGVMILGMTLLARWLFRALSEQRALREELRRREADARRAATHDPLTALPNRTLFDHNLCQALAEKQTAALLLLDLDRFKQVNDTLGHAAGDMLIREFGERLIQLVRHSDVVARLGGDEFAILCRGFRAIQDVEVLCQRIVEAVRQPFNLDGNNAFVGVSIGICVIPEGETDRIELMRKADIALYRAKADGRDRYCLFTPAMDETVKMRGTVEDDLRQALVTGEGFLLHYQPQIRCTDLAVVGFEALVRWRHPVRGLIPPNQFITVAEETGLIHGLGEWILREACKVSLRWPDMFMAVNLSPVQFRTQGFADRIIEIVGECGADPRKIELEVTESVILDDNNMVRKALEQLRAAGFRIALDDFGTGYSSLGYLREFQVDKIKIDRGFINAVSQSEASAAIVVAVLTLGHAMGLTVVAEGVETAEQQRFLVGAGCDVMQGYLFSPAVAEENIARFMAAQAEKRGAA